MTIDRKDLRALLLKAASVATHTSPTIHASAAAAENTIIKMEAAKQSRTLVICRNNTHLKMATGYSLSFNHRERERQK